MTHKAPLNVFFTTKTVRFNAKTHATTPRIGEIVIKLLAILLIPD